MAHRMMRSSGIGRSGDLVNAFNRVINNVPIVSEEPRTERSGVPAAEKPRKSIFTIASPPRVEEPRKGTDHYFLDACASCKKKIDFKEDIFMRGNFQAFCSKSCRDDQIAADEKVSVPSWVRKLQIGFICRLIGYRRVFNLCKRT